MTRDVMMMVLKNNLRDLEHYVNGLHIEAVREQKATFAKALREAIDILEANRWE